MHILFIMLGLSQSEEPSSCRRWNLQCVQAWPSCNMIGVSEPALGIMVLDHHQAGSV